MPSLDRVGVFIGEVLESTLGQSANGYPQWVARLKATKKYVSDPEEMKHFRITEPGYVDWSAYDESIVAYLVLFTDKGPLKNYEQLMAAVGWSGQDFQDLITFAGKTILFRVEENNYKDKVTLQVNWIDAADAPPERQLKSVDPSKIADLNKQFLAGMKKPTAPAKPVAAKPTQAAKVAATPPAPATQPAPPSAPVASTASPATDAQPAATTTRPPGRPRKTPPPPAVTCNPAPGLPEETTKDAAWEYLNQPSVRGSNDEGVVAEAWIAACAEVGENVDEEKFTNVMWGKVRSIVLKDLGVAVS